MAEIFRYHISATFKMNCNVKEVYIIMNNMASHAIIKRSIILKFITSRQKWNNLSFLRKDKTDLLKNTLNIYIRVHLLSDILQ